MYKLEDFKNNKIKLIFGITLPLLVIIAILGFVFESKSKPIRVSFDTKGGGVIFNHQLHVELKDSKCQECHHNTKPDQDEPAEMNCRNCHYSRDLLKTCETESIHKRCIGKNCTDCHTEGSVNCEFCHNAENITKVIEPKEVKFDTDGGLVIFDHFKHASPDEYDLSCDECHHGFTAEKTKTFPMNCRRCHYNTKYTPICENADTHMRCIGKKCLDCHTEGTEECGLCHKDE